MGSAAAAAAGGASHWSGVFEPARLDIDETSHGLVVVVGPHQWPVPRDCFGRSARLQKMEEPGRAGFSVLNGRLPGTELAFDLECEFERAPFALIGGWRMVVRGRGMPFRASVPFIPWLLGDTDAATTVDAATATKLVATLTSGEALVSDSIQLRLTRDLSWRLDGNVGSFSLMSGSLKARNAVVTTAAAGDGLFEALLDDPPRASSTCILFEGITCSADDDGLLIGHDGATALRLVPDHVNAVGLQTFETGERTSVTGATGTFRAIVDRGGTTSAGIETSEGIVLANRRGRHSFAAVSLPISDKPHLVEGDGQAFTIHREDDSHRLEVEARDGRLLSFRARGALTNFPAAIPGADYARLDFSDTEALISLGALPHPDAPQSEPVSGLPVVLVSDLPDAGAPYRPAPTKKHPPPAKSTRPSPPNPPEASSGLDAGIAAFNFAGPGGYEISLDGAKLRLLRGEDLLSLTFKFRGLKLVGAATQHPYIASSQDQYACGTKSPETLLIVEFPPQHVAEEAFFRLTETPPPNISEADFRQLVTSDPATALAKVAAALAALGTNLPDVPIDRNDVSTQGIPQGPTFNDKLNDRVEALKDAQSLDYKAFRQQFAAKAAAAGLTGAEAVYYGGQMPRSSAQPATQATQVYILVQMLTPATTAAAPGSEPLKPIARARLSGPSRLAFRLPCRDGTGEQRKLLDFTAAALTNWSGFDLKVVRRAERYLEGGQAVTDLAKILDFQSITKDVGWKERLQDIHDTSKPPPARDETAIELPFRLLLSPAQDARFRTPVAGAGTAAIGLRPVPLWHAELDEGSNGAGIRAVWSPDYDPNWFAKNPVVPESGPYAPWSATKTPFRASLSSDDRHQLVALSSVYGMPVLARKPDAPAPGNAPRPRPSNFQPPPHYAIIGPDVANPQNPFFLEPEGIYVPPPLDVSELTLTAIGGSLTLDTRFEPPAAPYTQDSKSLFNAFSLERWKHQAVLGRDIAVEVVYKGFLYPLGNRASLVKVTERRFLANPEGNFPTAYLIQRMFIRVSRPDKSYPGLGQPFDGRDFPVSQTHALTKRTPDILDPTMTAPGATGPEQATAYGRLQLAVQGLVFWPRTAPSLGGEVQFKFQIDGGDGAMQMPLLFADNTAVHDPPSMALIAGYYESLRSDNNDQAIKNLCTAQHSGAKRRYAPEKKSGEATFETDRWIFAVRGRLLNQQNSNPQNAGQPSGGPTGGAAPGATPGATPGGATPGATPGGAAPGATPPGGTPSSGTVPSGTPSGGTPPGGPQPNVAQQDFTMDAAMEGQDQPPFYPWLYETFVKLRQVDNFTGNSSSWVGAGFAEIYVRNGLSAQQNPSELYLQLIDQVSLDVSQSGDRSGGVAKPNGMVLGLSRKLGPVTGRQGTPPPTPPGQMQVGLPAHPGLVAAQSGRFDPSEFFGGALSEAKLLGLLPLKDLIKIAGIAAAPVLKETFSYATAQATDDAPATMAAVQSAIAPVAATLLKAVQDFRNTAEQSLQSIAPDASPPRLAWLYPGLSQALTNFEATLNADNFKSTDPATLFDNVTAVIEAGGQLVDQLQTVVANPTPLFVQDAIAKFSAAYSVLRSWPDTVKEQLAASVQQAAISQLQSVLCSDQTMFAITVFGPALATSCSQLNPSDPDAITKFVQALQAAVKAEAEDFASTEEEDVLQTGEAMFFDAVGVPLFNVLNQLQALRTAQAQSATALGQQVITLIGQVFDVADAIDRAPAIQKVIGDAQQACALTAAFFDKAVKALGFPNPQQIRDQAKNLQTAFANLATLEQNLRSAVPASGLPDAQTAAVLDAVARLRTACGAGADRLAKTLIDALDTRDKVVNTVVSQVCQVGSTAQRTWVQSLQLLFALRRRAIVETRDLFGKVAGALDPSVLPPAVPAGAAPAPAPGAGPAAAVLNTSTPDLDQFATEIQSTVTALTLIFKEVTGLAGRVAATSPQYDADRAKLIGDLEQSANDIVAAFNTAAGDTARFGTQIQTDINQVRDAGGAIAKDWAAKVPSSLPTKVQDLAVTVLNLAQVATKAGAFSQNCERKLVAEAAAAIAVQDFDITKFEAAIIAIVKPALDIIIQIDTAALNALNPLYSWLSTTLTPTDQKSFALFFMPAPAAGQTLDQIVNLFNPKPVSDETAKLSQASNDLAAGDLQKALSGLAGVRSDWQKNGGPALAQVFTNVEAVANKLLHGKLTDFIDVGAFIATIENELLQFIPVQYDMKYDFNTHVGDLGDLFAIIRDNDPPRTPDVGDDVDKDLTLSAHLSVNLLDPSKRSFTIQGTLQPFKVELLPQLNAVTLKFAPATFTSTDGSKPKFDVKVSDVIIGPELQFLAALGDFLSPKGGNGFFITPQWAPPGIEAGFGIDLGTISLGEVSFLNVSLGASCLLPFDDRPAQFYVNLARRDAPFMISALPFGGGGFFSLIATSKGIVGFEASFEGGFVAAFSYGPLDAEGRISLGIYVAKTSDSAQISGYFFAGGSAHIACFAVSAALLVSFISDGSSMTGQATFTFTFSVGLCDFSYSVGVAHSIGGGFSSGVNSTGFLEDGGSGSQFADDTVEPAGVKLAMLLDQVSSDSLASITGSTPRPHAPPRPPTPARRKITPTVSRLAVSMTRDWTVYRTYFDNDL
jgi:hypothetical protein